MRVAAEHAVAAGYPDGRLFSVHVTISFLLGTRWSDDPFHAIVPRILSTPGLSLDDRLNMALSAAVRLRQELDAIQAQMHPTIIGVLTEITGDTPRLDDVWRSYRDLAHMRGIALHQTDALWDLYVAYETDACRLLGYAGIRRDERLNAYERLGYEHMRLRMPLPTDDYQTLDPRLRLALIQHVLLALVFGRHFRTNQLFRGLHDILAEPDQGSTRSAGLRSFLNQHLRVLGETPYGL